jgi:hypothetical protein
MGTTGQLEAVPTVLSLQVSQKRTISTRLVVWTYSTILATTPLWPFCAFLEGGEFILFHLEMLSLTGTDSKVDRSIAVYTSIAPRVNISTHFNTRNSSLLVGYSYDSDDLHVNRQLREGSFTGSTMESHTSQSISLGRHIFSWRLQNN